LAHGQNKWKKISFFVYHISSDGKTEQGCGAILPVTVVPFVRDLRFDNEELKCATNDSLENLG